MPAAELLSEAILWTDTSRVSLCEAIADRLVGQVRVIGVGGPQDSDARQLAETLDCSYHDDLRRLLIECPARGVLLASRAQVDTDRLRDATDAETKIVTLDLLGHELASLQETQDAAPQRELLGRLLNSPGPIAADPDDALGNHRAASIVSLGPRSTHTLATKLFDAWQSVVAWVGLPELIDTAIHPQPPESLSSMTGRVTAHARGPGLSISLLAGDAGPRLQRSFTIVGDAATLHATDTTYRLEHSDGRLMDESTDPPTYSSDADLLAEQWLRQLRADPPPRIPVDRERQDQQALACCLACLLSARTGQPESPARQLELAGAGV